MSSNTTKGKKGPSRAQVKAAALAAAAAVDVPASCDVAVCGGGASGLVAGIFAAEKGARVVMLERDLECGRTILATGNGRCNFANMRLEAARYNAPEFVQAAAGNSWLADILGFFEGCGLAWAEEDGRLYPLSNQAASVREVLLARARRAGVVMACAREVLDVRRDGDGWDVTYRDAFGGEKTHELAAASVVLAGGGKSEVFDSLGLEVAPREAVLCGLAGRGKWPLELGELDGRRARGRVSLVRDGQEIYAEKGEVLFRAGGLSGICVFDLSRRAVTGDEVHIDLLDTLDDDRLAKLQAAGCAEGLLDPVICTSLKRAGADPVAAARDLVVSVDGKADETRAQVSRGGIVTSQLDTNNLQVKSLPGLFACGEVLDVDADCGGFNLAWAWKSGQVAGNGAAAHASAHIN